MYHLGQLVIANGVSVNNLSTATPFAIPAGIVSFRILASGSDCYAEFKPVKTASAAAFATTATNGVPIGTTLFPFPGNPLAPSGPQAPANILAVFNNNAASRTVDVWACYGDY